MMQLGAHAGCDRTYDSIKKHYYFKNMHEYVSSYIESCHVCQCVKNPKNKSWSPLGVIEAKYPFDLISIDIWFPGVTSKNGNNCVLTIIDGFTKWAWAEPLPNHKAETVARALHRVFSIQKWPTRLHSDCGAEFVGEVLNSFTELFGIESSRTTAYNHQGNAYAERIHRYFRQALSSFVLDDHRVWDDYMYTLLSVYNDTLCSATGTTPNIALTGSPGNMVSLEYVPQKELERDIATLTYVEKLNYILNKVHAVLTQKNEEKAKKNLKYATGKTQTKFEVGQEVMLYRPERKTLDSMKLTPRWFGPYKITRVLNNHKVYYLKDTWDDDIPYPVSVLHLKPYIRRDGEVITPTKLPDDNEALSDQGLLLEPYDNEEAFTVAHHIYNQVDDPEEQEQLDSLAEGQQKPREKSNRKRVTTRKIIVPELKASKGRRVFGRKPYY